MKLHGCPEEVDRCLKHVAAHRDVLCTDKTGTLTVDEVHLFKALDIAGQESLEILRLAYANSSFQAGPFHKPQHISPDSKSCISDCTVEPQNLQALMRSTSMKYPRPWISAARSPWRSSGWSMRIAASRQGPYAHSLAWHGILK